MTKKHNGREARDYRPRSLALSVHTTVVVLSVFILLAGCGSATAVPDSSGTPSGAPSPSASVAVSPSMTPEENPSPLVTPTNSLESPTCRELVNTIPSADLPATAVPDEEPPFECAGPLPDGRDVWLMNGFSDWSYGAFYAAPDGTLTVSAFTWELERVSFTHEVGGAATFDFDGESAVWIVPLGWEYFSGNSTQVAYYLHDLSTDTFVVVTPRFPDVSGLQIVWLSDGVLYGVVQADPGAYRIYLDGVTEPQYLPDWQVPNSS